jgi:hypothetical protein
MKLGLLADTGAVGGHAEHLHDRGPTSTPNKTYGR